MAVSDFLADAEAFSRFYRGNARWVLLFFARRTIEAEAALDLTAETFASTFASRGSFRGTTDGEAGAWLFAIARRQLPRYFEAGTASRQLVRRLVVETPQATEVELERIDALAGLGALGVALREQLEQLDVGQREALWLRVVDAQPYALVAARLGISEQAARARVSRALRGLAEPLAALAVTVEEHG